jgi:kanosamine-6-phosphate phosphatase
MNLNKIRHLTFPDFFRFAVFSDFDESWYAHSRTVENVNGLRTLESYLEDYIQLKKDLLVGWVSGCTTDLIVKRIEAHDSNLIFPHFIAGAHGTELNFCCNGTFKKDTQWEKKVKNSGFNKEVTRVLVSNLKDVGIVLIPQVQEGEFIHSFYLPLEKADKINTILEFSKKIGVHVNISQSNHLAGDPDNTFDIDFLPFNCSKKLIVKYLLQKFNIEISNAFAFGDNVTDLEMLSFVGNGYLLKNATCIAKKQYSKILNKPYACGIYSCLKNYFK